MAEVTSARRLSERLAVSAANKPNLAPIVSKSLPSNIGRGMVSLKQLQFSSLGLYGRDREVALLRDAYQRVRCSEAMVEMVLISGESGTGKSALVKSLCRKLNSGKTSEDSFCVSGKFDLHRRVEPLSAMIPAFSQLCDDIISFKDMKNDMADQFTKLRDSIQASVGSEAIDVIPNLWKILGDGQDIKKSHSIIHAYKEGGYDGSKTKNRFKFLIRQFFRAICSPSHPLVLVLDDLQWADQASLELIELLATDTKLSGLLIICCFRDNEVDRSEHLLSEWLHRIEELGTRKNTSTKILLRNLSVNSINELIADVLCSDKARTQRLAGTVHEKTLGNPFFFKQFLTALQDNDLLYYCFVKLSWQWDEEKIKAGTNVADNIVDLLKHKIQSDLNLPTRNLLQVAACLGSTFDEMIIVPVMEALLMRGDRTNWCNCRDVNSDRSDSSLQVQKVHAERISKCLELCVSEGFLQRTKTGAGASVRYRFVHDQIQQAAFSLIPEDERKLWQLHIGKTLLDNLSVANLEAILFVATDLCNSGASLDTLEAKEKILLSKLNLRAGVKAMQSSAAFTSAAAYLNVGITLLGPNHWVEHYDLCLALFSTAAEAEYCNGNVVLMRQYINEVLAQAAVPFLDKYGVYCTLVRSLCAENKLVEATNTILYVLRQLGMKIPKFGLKLCIVSSIMDLERTFRKRSVGTLVDLPVMRDEIKIKAMVMMDKLCTVAFAHSPDLAVFGVMKLVQWSVYYGVCSSSPGAFAMLGSIYCYQFCNLRKGHELGKVALALSKKINSKETEARNLYIMHTALFHWVIPVQTTCRPLLSAYQIGMETGNVDDAMMSLNIYIGHSLTAGRSLLLLKTDMKAYYQQMREYEQERPASCILPLWQLVLNLTDFSTDPTVLTGEVMDQDVEVRRINESNDSLHLYMITTCQIWLAYYFQDYRLAWKLVVESRSMAKYSQPLHLTWRNALFEGLVAFSLARKTKSTKWKRRATKVVERVRKWTKKGNVNCPFCVCLFKAEMSALGGGMGEAKSAYDQAICTAAKYGNCNDKALATERAGEFFIDIDDIYRGKHYLSLAHQLYVDWGAQAKADKMMKKHSRLLSTLIPE